MAESVNTIDEEKKAVLDDLISRFNNAESVFEYEDLKSEFEELGDFFDAKNFAAECMKKIDLINEEKKNLDYQIAVSCLNKAKTAAECDRLKEYFVGLGKYKSAEYYSGLCMKIKDEILTTENYKNQAARIKNNDYRSQTNTAASKNSPVRTKKNSKEVSEGAKTITLALELATRLPMMFTAFMMIIILGADADNMIVVTYIMVLIVGLIIDIVKIGYSFFCLSEAGIVFEEGFPLLSSINKVDNSFLQAFFRLLIFAGINVIYFVLASILMIITIFEGL